jgi:glucosamine--fructose-6-phosphate aminotransferase (isomerizing)
VHAALTEAGSHASALPHTDTAASAAAALAEVNTELQRAIDLLTTVTAGHLLATDTEFATQVRDRIDAVNTQLQTMTSRLDSGSTLWDADDVERVQLGLRSALDLVWTLSEDRVRSAERVRALAGTRDFPLSASIAYFALDTVLDALDRLEVRGRDSAGVHLWIRLDDNDVAALPAGLEARRDLLFRDGAIERLPGGLSIVYKTASLVGRLGDNVRALRAAITADPALLTILSLPSAQVSVLAHTRWASVGRISSPNAHPLCSVVTGERDGVYAVGAVNGDIDNHGELREREELPANADITTDAKLVPVMMARRTVAGGPGAGQVLRECLKLYRGSMAIAAQTDAAPGELLLGLKGGGQGLYIGLGPSGYLVASEVFGLVSHSTRYLRIDSDDSSGTVVSVDIRGNGTLAGIRRLNASGIAQEIPSSELRIPEVTTRDVALGGHERYLEKELSEAPSSFRKTLRGRIQERGGKLSVQFPESTLPARIRKMFADGLIDEVVFIGQGTAAVAASGVARIVDTLVGNKLRIRSMPATELSAWHLHEDLGRTCVVAISQSGTTTDTNRTVDLVRERGALVLAIVNRRDSDLVGKSDGVFYTSDGRDIEMAVASTKAFYAQVAAGMLLGLGLAKELGVLDPNVEDARLRVLTEIPGKLEELEKDKAAIAAVAEKVACRYRYWAVLGSGPNRIAAAEVRIKLSELCYCGVSADAIEDKKHIDLSAESLVLVCAAGTPVTQVHDLIKEVDIFTAHHNQPVVIIDAGTRHLWSTDLVIEVPPTHPILSWLLSVAAGHYFGYYAARAIDAAADDLRMALAALDSGGRAVAATRLGQFLDDAEAGRYSGVLTSEHGVRLAKARWLLEGDLPVHTLFPDADGDPEDVIRQVLDSAIDALTRSIDSVKHQAKTVTVGTSRSGADLFDNTLARAALELGTDRDALSYSTLVALRDYAKVIAGVRGGTRYSVTDAQIRTVRKSGIARDLYSRADDSAPLVGTKKLAADTRTVRLERGLTDGRLVLIIPELSGTRIAGISLLHVDLVDRATPDGLLAALQQQGNRLLELQAAITERNLPFAPEDLVELGPEVALLAPVSTVAAAVGG